MPVTINPVITDAGLNAAVNAANNGLRLEITHIALGTGRYDPVTSAPGMVSMVGLKEYVSIGAGVSAGTGSFTLAVRFESWTGTPNPYNATEIGFYAGDPSAGGILFAVHSHQSDVVVQRNQLDYVASFTLQLARVPAGSVAVQINPDGPQMMALLNLHLNDTDPHAIYLKRTGDTATGLIKGVTAPKNDNGKNFATTEYVLNVGANFPQSGIIAVADNITLKPEQSGCIIDVQTGGRTLTLPRSSLCRVGAAFTVRMSSTSGMLAAQAGDSIWGQGIYHNPFQMAMGDTVTVVRNENGVWHLFGGSGSMPTGATSFILGDVAPPGWLKLNGALISRAAYPALWAFAQRTFPVTETAWMSGNFWGRFSTGTSGDNFRLPDTRGTFLRAFDDGRGFDAGRSWGTFQEQSIQSHDHLIATAEVFDVRAFIINDRSGDSIVSSDNTPADIANMRYDRYRTAAYGSAETRPHNLSYQHCIKF